MDIKQATDVDLVNELRRRHDVVVVAVRDENENGELLRDYVWWRSQFGAGACIVSNWANQEIQHMTHWCGGGVVRRERDKVVGDE